MVVLVDWTDFIVFDSKRAVGSIKHGFVRGIDEVLEFKWVLLREGEKSNKVSFRIRPSSKAITFPKTLYLKEGKNNMFSLSVNTKSLPDNWMGELIIKSEDVVTRIPVEFEKIETTH